MKFKRIVGYDEPIPCEYLFLYDVYLGFASHFHWFLKHFYFDLVDDGVVLRVVSCKVSFDPHEDLAPAYLIQDEYVCDTDKT